MSRTNGTAPAAPANRIVDRFGVTYPATEPARRPVTRARSGSTSLTGGGIKNNKTGLGSKLDNSEFSFFTPTRLYSRSPLEVVYVESWAARKFIDIPIDDMLIRWRVWQGDEGDQAAEAMADAEKRHHAAERLRGAMKDGRLYGSALLVMATREAPLDEPLEPERVRPGDLAALHVFDRFSAYVSERDYDLMSPTFGQPVEYYVYPRKGSGKGAYIHASRVLRFDGLVSNSADGYQHYDYDWGVSEIIPAVTSIMQDAVVAQAAAHLSQVASIPVLAVDGLRETLAGDAYGEMSAHEIASDVNELMSVFRLLMLDRGSEEFNRVAVNFAGLDKLIDRIERRLAAAADIPVTRFYAQSPAGMNATGESDWRNYMTMVMAKREAMLPGPLARLDMVLARDAGLSEPPEYTWPDLLELSEKERAEVAKVIAEANEKAINANTIIEEEGRAALPEMVYGPLGDMPAELTAAINEPEPAPMPPMPPMPPEESGRTA